MPRRLKLAESTEPTYLVSEVACLSEHSFELPNALAAAISAVEIFLLAIVDEHNISGFMTDLLLSAWR